MERLLSFKDLQALGIVGNRVTLMRWIRRRGFPTGALIGENSRRWSETEVKAWLDARRAQSTKPASKQPAAA
jgi:predicted DNA-binding transcriptional regulator AlpA